MPTFYKLGLDLIWFTCADYHAHSANVYFFVPGVVAKDQAAQLAELAGSPPPTDEEFEDMQQLMSPKGVSLCRHHEGPGRIDQQGSILCSRSSA